MEGNVGQERSLLSCLSDFIGIREDISWKSHWPELGNHGHWNLKERRGWTFLNLENWHREKSWERLMESQWMRGAGGRTSTHGKGQEEGGSTYAKVGSSLRSPPGNSRASTPKIESAYFTTLCSPLHLWLYGGLFPTTSFGEGVNLELQLIIIPGRDSVSTYKLLWRFSSLPDRLVRPHVIAHSLPTVRGTRCFKPSKNRFLRKVRKPLV